MGSKNIPRAKMREVAQYVADYIAVFLGISALIILLFLLVFLQNSQSILVTKYSIMLFLLITGLLGSKISGVQLSTTEILGKRGILTLFTIGLPWIFLSTVYILNAKQLNTDLVTISFYVLAAICEEWFFRGFLLTWLITIFNNIAEGNIFYRLSSYVIVSLLFTAFHGYVYAISMTHIFIFLASMVFCIAYDVSKNLSTPMIIHVVWNAALVMTSTVTITIS